MKKIIATGLVLSAFCTTALAASYKVDEAAPKCIHDQVWLNVAKGELLYGKAVASSGSFTPQARADVAQLKSVADAMYTKCSQITDETLRKSLADLKHAKNEIQMGDAIRSLRELVSCQHNALIPGESILKTIRDQVGPAQSHFEKNEWIRYWVTQTACLEYAAKLVPLAETPEIKNGVDLSFKSGPRGTSKLEAIPEKLIDELNRAYGAGSASGN